MQPVERMVMENYLSKQHSATFSSAIKRSLCVGGSDVDDDDSFEDFMMIGMPSDVKHVTHVTFDRFRGFLGVPQDIERMLPGRAPSASQKVFGVKPESMQCSYDDHGNSVPTILLLLQARLYNQGGLQKEGIFRVAAGNDHEEHVRVQLSMGVVPKNIDVYALAGLIKAWFRELPEGVLDSANPDQVERAARSEDEALKLTHMLPSVQRSLIDWAVNLMADVAEYEPHNKMSPRNIAMVFAPNMTQVLDPVTALMHAVQVTNYLRSLVERKQKDRLNALNLATLQSLNSPMNSLSSTPSHSRQPYATSSTDAYSPQVSRTDMLLFRTFSTPEQDLLPDGFVVEGSTDDNASKPNSGLIQSNHMHEGFGLDMDDVDADWDSFPLDNEPMTPVQSQPLTAFSPAADDDYVMEGASFLHVEDGEEGEEDVNDVIRDVDMDEGYEEKEEEKKKEAMPASLTQMFMAGWGDVGTDPGEDKKDLEEEEEEKDVHGSYKQEYDEYVRKKQSKWYEDEKEMRSHEEDAEASSGRKGEEEEREGLDRKKMNDDVAADTRIPFDRTDVSKDRFGSFDSTETLFSENGDDVYLSESQRLDLGQCGQSSSNLPILENSDALKQKNSEGHTRHQQQQQQHGYESLSEITLKENELYNFAIQRTEKKASMSKHSPKRFSKSRFNRELDKKNTDLDRDDDEDDDMGDEEDEGVNRAHDCDPDDNVKEGKEREMVEKGIVPMHNVKVIRGDSDADGDDEFSEGNDNTDFESHPFILHRNQSNDVHALVKHHDPSPSSSSSSSSPFSNSSVHDISIRMISTGSEINNIVISPSRGKREGGSLRYEITQERIGSFPETSSKSSDLSYSDSATQASKAMAVQEGSEGKTESPSLIISINHSHPEPKNSPEGNRPRIGLDQTHSGRPIPEVSRRNKSEGSQLRLRRLKKAAEESESGLGVNPEAKKSASLHIGTPSMEIKVEQLVANVTMRFVGLLDDSPRPRTPVGFEAVSRSSNNRDNFQ